MATLYEDFGSRQSTAISTKQLEDAREALEDEKLSSFESGYQAGWDDAMQAQGKLEKTISASLADKLQDASFQYHEMRKQLLQSVEDMMQSVVTTTLPTIAHKTLGAHISEAVTAHTRNTLDGGIELVVHPEAGPRVEPLIAHVSDRFNLSADAALTPDQAFIRFADAEHKIDLGRINAEISSAVSDFFEAQWKEAPDD